MDKTFQMVDHVMMTRALNKSKHGKSKHKQFRDHVEVMDVIQLDVKH